MAIHKGDRIHLEVQASYEENSRKPIKDAGILATIASALKTPVGIGEAAGAAQAINELLAGTVLLDNDQNGLPKAYLNYIIGP